MKWIASNNVVPNLDKTNIMKFMTNNSTYSALCIYYFAMYLCLYNNTISTKVAKTLTLFLYIYIYIYFKTFIPITFYSNFLITHPRRISKFTTTC